MLLAALTGWLVAWLVIGHGVAALALALVSGALILLAAIVANAGRER